MGEINIKNVKNPLNFSPVDLHNIAAQIIDELKHPFVIEIFKDELLDLIRKSGKTKAAFSWHKLS